MKINLARVFFVAAALPAFGEAAHQLTATVPFRFNVGEKTFDAGDYRVEDMAGSGVTIVRSADNKSAAIVQSSSTISSQPQATGRLVFRCGEGRCYLAEIWSPGTAQGRSIQQSKAERDKVTRSGIPARVRVSVALR